MGFALAGGASRTAAAAAAVAVNLKLTGWKSDEKEAVGSVGAWERKRPLGSSELAPGQAWDTLAA